MRALTFKSRPPLPPPLLSEQQDLSRSRTATRWDSFRKNANEQTTLFHSFEQPSKEVSVEKSFKTDEEDGPKPKPAETKKVKPLKKKKKVSAVTKKMTWHYKSLVGYFFFFFNRKARHNPLPTASKVVVQSICARDRCYLGRKTADDHLCLSSVSSTISVLLIALHAI